MHVSFNDPWISIGARKNLLSFFSFFLFFFSPTTTLPGELNGIRIRGNTRRTIAARSRSRRSIEDRPDTAIERQNGETLNVLSASLVPELIRIDVRSEQWRRGLDLAVNRVTRHVAVKGLRFEPRRRDTFDEVTTIMGEHRGSVNTY